VFGKIDRYFTSDIDAIKANKVGTDSFVQSIDYYFEGASSIQVKYNNQKSAKRHGNTKRGSLTTKLPELKSIPLNKKAFNKVEAAFSVNGNLSAIGVSGKGLPQQFLWFQPFTSSLFKAAAKSKKYGPITLLKETSTCPLTKAQLIGFATSTAKRSGPIKSI